MEKGIVPMLVDKLAEHNAKFTELNDRLRAISKNVTGVELIPQVDPKASPGLINDLSKVCANFDSNVVNFEKLLSTLETAL